MATCQKSAGGTPKLTSTNFTSLVPNSPPTSHTYCLQVRATGGSTLVSHCSPFPQTQSKPPQLPSVGMGECPLELQHQILCHHHHHHHLCHHHLCHHLLNLWDLNNPIGKWPKGESVGPHKKMIRLGFEPRTSQLYTGCSNH